MLPAAAVAFSPPRCRRHSSALCCLRYLGNSLLLQAPSLSHEPANLRRVPRSHGEADCLGYLGNSTVKFCHLSWAAATAPCSPPRRWHLLRRTLSSSQFCSSAACATPAPLPQPIGEDTAPHSATSRPKYLGSGQPCWPFRHALRSSGEFRPTQLCSAGQ